MSGIRLAQRSFIVATLALSFTAHAGYAHHFQWNKKPDPAALKACIAEMAKIIAARKILLAGPDGAGAPDLQELSVAFNGKGDASHEPFIFPGEIGFNFCKTQWKPYDEAVTACLLCAHDHFDNETLTISSDGEWNAWGPGADLYELALKREAKRPLTIRLSTPGDTIDLSDFDDDDFPVYVSRPWYTRRWMAWGGSMLGLLFWLWMFADCYKRSGGLNYWHYLFFFMPPSTAIYFLINMSHIFKAGGSGSFFGPSLGSRIRTAENRLRVSDTLEAHMTLGDLYHEANRFADCEREYRIVLAAEPENLEALYHIGQCRGAQGDHVEALSFLQRVINKDRKLRFGRAWLQYTVALLANGRRDDALEERKKLARAFPRPLTEFAYGELLADAGQKEKAREVLQEMLATSQDAPREDRKYLSMGRKLLKTLG